MSLLLTKIEIKNFGPYVGKHAITFKEGYTSFIGRNGHGKSILGMAMPWILGGAKAVGSHEADFKTLGAGASPWGRATFSGNGKEIIVERSSAKASVTVDGEKVANTKVGALEEIERLFKVTPATLGATNYIAQGEMQNLVSRKSDIRVKTVESVIGTENFKNLESVYRRKTKGPRSVVNEYDDGPYQKAKAIISVLEDDISKIEKDIQRKQAEVKKLNLDVLRNKVKVTNKELQVYIELEDELERLRDERESQKVSMESMEKRIKELKLAMDRVNTTLDTLPNQEIDKVEAEYTEAKRGHDAALQDMEDMGVSVYNLNKKLHTLQGQISVVSKPLEEYSEKEHKRLIEKLKKERREYIRLSTNIEDLARVIQSCESDAGVCSRCGSELTKDHLSHLTRQLKADEEKYLKLDKIFEQSVKLEEDFCKLKSMWESYNSRTESNEEIHKEIEYIQVQLKEALKKMNLKSKTESELLRTLNDVEHELKSIRETRVHRETLVGEYQKYAIDAVCVKDLLKDFKAKYTKTYKDITHIEMVLKEGESSYDHLVTEMNELNARIESKESTERSLKYALDALVSTRDDKKIDLYEARGFLGRFEDGHEKFLSAKDELSYLSQAKKIVMNFRHSYQNKIKPSIESIVNQVYSAVGDGEYTAIALDDQYEITGKKGDYDVPSSVFSGAEKDTLAFAFRVALSRLKQLISGNPLGIMIIDEPTAQFDNHRIDNFIHVLDRMGDLVPQIVCITHNEKLKQIGRSYSVTMRNGISSVKGD